MPAISICITCYNARTTIEQALESARAQTSADREIVVIDDYSTDGSREFLAQYYESHSIRLVLPDRNLGIPAARNQLVRNARGEFIAFFDDDDISVPERLQEQYQMLLSAARSGVEAICYTGRTQVYGDGTSIDDPGLHSPGRTFVDGAEVLKWALVGRYGSRLAGSAGTGTMMAPKRVLEALGFDEALRRCSDTDLLVRAALAGYKIVAVTRPMILQRMGNSRDKSLEIRQQAQRQLLEKHAPVLSALGVADLARRMSILQHRLLRGERLGALRAALSVAFNHPAASGRIALTALHRRRVLRSRRAQFQSQTE